MSDADPVPSGLSSLHYIFGGGDAARRCHLIEGQSWSGKTTLAFQLLADRAMIVAGNPV